MAEAGLTPEKVIRAATRNAAEHLGLLEDLGTIEPGKIADLIIRHFPSVHLALLAVRIKHGLVAAIPKPISTVHFTTVNFDMLTARRSIIKSPILQRLKTTISI